MGTCMTLSTFSTCSLEEVSESAPDCLRRFQLYVVPDRHITKDLVLRAKTAGFKALVITVDTEVVGIKYASTENHLHVLSSLDFPTFDIKMVNHHF